MRSWAEEPRAARVTQCHPVSMPALAGTGRHWTAESPGTLAASGMQARTERSHPRLLGGALEGGPLASLGLSSSVCKVGISALHVLRAESKRLRGKVFEEFIVSAKQDDGCYFQL